jgi:hypothetical protein
MFLALAAQHNHVRIPRNFLDYWQVLEGPLGRPLGYRAQMDTLNKVRVSLKHYGIQPPEIEIQAAGAAVRGLLFDECPSLLGVDLKDVSLRDLVMCKKARDLLARAEQLWAAGNDQTRCFGEIQQALDAVINDYKNRKTFSPGHSVFDTLSPHGLRSPFSRRIEGDQRRFEDDVIEGLRALDRRIALLGLGIDFRRYGRFRTLVPGIVYAVDGSAHIQEWRKTPRTEEDYEFCAKFVIDVAIHLSEVDYDYDLWAERQTTPEKESARP